jgi:hypothetical protein
MKVGWCNLEVFLHGGLVHISVLCVQISYSLQIIVSDRAKPFLFFAHNQTTTPPYSPLLLLVKPA